MGINSSPPAVSSLKASYTISADLKLWRQGLSLRVRDEDGRQVQTLKSSDFHKGDFLSRGEWEDVIAGDRPDLAAPETGPRFGILFSPTSCDHFSRRSCGAR